jgi:hypothetical protein
VPLKTVSSGARTVYAVMTAAECDAHPEWITGSWSVVKAGLTSVIDNNLGTLVTLHTNPKLLDVLDKKGAFLRDNVSKKFFGKTKAAVKALYGRLLLSFDLLNPADNKMYRFFIVDPYPITAVTTALIIRGKTPQYPALSQINKFS